MRSFFPLDVCVAFSLMLMGTGCREGAADPMFYSVCKMPYGFFSLGYSEFFKCLKEEEFQGLEKSQYINSTVFTECLAATEAVIIIS